MSENPINFTRARARILDERKTPQELEVVLRTDSSDLPDAEIYESVGWALGRNGNRRIDDTVEYARGLSEENVGSLFQGFAQAAIWSTAATEQGVKRAQLSPAEQKVRKDAFIKELQQKLQERKNPQQ